MSVLFLAGWATACTTTGSKLSAASPAHTWIGFNSSDMGQESGNHWTLLREPQVIVFNLNDFGSFGIHVTIPEAGPELEAILDKLAASVVFQQSEPETTGSEARFDRYVALTWIRPRLPGQLQLGLHAAIEAVIKRISKRLANGRCAILAPKLVEI